MRSWLARSDSARIPMKDVTKHGEAWPGSTDTSCGKRMPTKAGETHDEVACRQHSFTSVTGWTRPRGR